MIHDILRFLASRSTSIAPFFYPILLVFLQTAIWDWQSGKQQARRSTFFGVRVEPGFIASARSGSILKRFRRSIWFLSLAIVFAYILFPWRNSLGPQYWAKSTIILFFAPMIGNLVMFGLANRQTRRETVVLPGPSTRTAALFVEEEESSPWLTVLDWLGIVLPIGIPLIATSIVILCWNEFPRNYSPLAELKHVLLMGGFGIFPAATYFALRFRAWSSDWAHNSRSSRQYRTVLGLIQSSVFSFMIFNSCWLPLTLIKGEPFGDMNTHYRYSLPAGLCLIATLLGMRIYLRRNLARECSDPMPDRCWKWGYFYYNPDDPALVVPSRSGTAFSYNHASHSVWIVGAIVLSVTLFTFLSFFAS
jgi:uncharacterized membrane protein